MLPIFTAYPQFAPNQILTSNNLNQLYDYLYEQERLTRTHLIGIGIVCGLEASLNDEGDQLTISRGCGVTSAGHLIIWDEDEPLEFRRPYSMPEDIDYPFFDLPGDPANTYPLWELTTDRDDDGEAEELTHDFLIGVNQDEDAGEGDEKVLLLLLECRAMDNSNCTPTSCDDKGRTVETVVKPLLIRRGDLEEIRRVLIADHPGVDAYYALSQSYADRLALPTLRAPRFDVTNTSPVTSYSLLKTYTTTLSSLQLTRVQEALDEAYDTLAPLLTGYSANPFAGNISGMTFLHDGTLLDSTDAILYQYYYDHLVTIVHAYDELRDRAEELFGLCCPDPDIFPRHLVLNHFTDAGISNELRHTWVSSPVQNRQADAGKEVLTLFDRLVSLIEDVDLPDVRNKYPNIRITPSFLGGPLSAKAIPYYYTNGDLVNRWSYAQNRSGRSAENLGYRASEWNTGDEFVRNPLLYDLEPRNFLRIEGAIGQDYLSALNTIRTQIESFRLPIDVVALRTGALIEGLEIADYTVHFSDLQSQYAVIRESLLGRMAEVLVRFYDTKMLDNQGNPTGGGFAGTPQAPLLQRLTGYQYLRGTVGAYYEDHYAQHTATGPYLVGFDLSYIFHLFIIHALVPIESKFTTELQSLDFTDVETTLAAYQGGSRFLSRIAAAALNDAQTGGPLTSQKIDLEEYSDQLDELVTTGDLEALRALYAEYEARRQRILERQLFATFQQEHPGLQFKAGSPLGGTFVLVYHGADGYTLPPRTGTFRLFGRVYSKGKPIPGARVSVVDRSQVATTLQNGQFKLTVNDLPAQLMVQHPGSDARIITVQDEEQFLDLDLGGITAPTSGDTIPGLTAGTVLADFYLPYRCCGDGLPIHIYPAPPNEEPSEPLVASVRQVGCTRLMRNIRTAEVEFTVSGGTPPYFLEDQNGNRQTLPEGPQEIFIGFSGKVIDSGSESVPVAITLRDEMALSLIGGPVCSGDNKQYTQSFQVTGGEPPYTYLQPDGSQVTIPTGGTGTVKDIPSGAGFTLVVTDSSEAKCSEQIVIGPHTCTIAGAECNLPCGGIATRSSYPLWLQRPNTDVTEYREVSIDVVGLSLTDETGTVIALTANDLGVLNNDIATVLAAENNLLSFENFPDATKAILEALAQAVNKGINMPLGLPNSEPGLSLSFVDDEAFARFNAQLFDCYAWSMMMRISYREGIKGRDQSIPRQRTVTYQTGNAVFASSIVLDNQSNQSRAVAPSFDRFRLNRCDPKAPEVALCATPPPEVEIIVEGQGRGRKLSVDGNPDGLRPFWDMGFAVPNLSNEESLGVGFLSGDLNAGVYLLLADPDTGCFRVARTNIGT